MENFEAKFIGDDLFQVTIDGVAQPTLYTREQVGDLYAALWTKSKEAENAL